MECRVIWFLDWYNISKLDNTSDTTTDFLQFIASLQDSDAPEAMELDGNVPEVKEECEDRIKEEKMEVEGTTSSQEVQVSKDKSKKKRKRSESFSGQKETKTSEDVKPDMIDEDVKADMTNDDVKLDTSKEDVQPDTANSDDVVERKKSKKKRKRSESCDAVQRVKVEKLEVGDRGYLIWERNSYSKNSCQS